MKQGKKRIPFCSEPRIPPMGTVVILAVRILYEGCKCDYDEDQAFPEELLCWAHAEQLSELATARAGAVGRTELQQWVHTTIYKIGTQQGPTLYTGNSTQYAAIIYMGKNLKKNRYMRAC